MKIGLYVTAAGEQVRVAYAVIQGAECVEAGVVASPAGESTGPALYAVAIRLRALFSRNSGASVVRLLRVEKRGGLDRSTQLKVRAEGTILTLAGELNLDVEDISPKSVSAATPHSGIEDAAASLSESIGGNWGAAHVRAVAVAVAELG